VILGLLACPLLHAAAQVISVDRGGDALAIRASGFAFLNGDVLARLKDGRAVRIEIAAMALPGPGKTPVAQGRQAFAVSYDLWEERFAVTTAAAPPRAVSHLTSSAAEAWCVEQVTIPIHALGALGRGQPFWIRLEYRILDGEDAQRPDDGAGFTLQGLIDVLSRRRKVETATHSVEAGPFRLQPRPPGASSPR
jgi:hypothetical protein